MNVRLIFTPAEMTGYFSVNDTIFLNETSIRTFSTEFACSPCVSAGLSPGSLAFISDSRTSQQNRFSLTKEETGDVSEVLRFQINLDKKQQSKLQMKGSRIRMILTNLNVCKEKLLL